MSRLNKVEFVPSSLHGYKLLRLEPKVTAALVRFLDTTLKSRPAEWEPQYNLTPVTFGDPQLVETSSRPIMPRTRQKIRPRRIPKRAPPVEHPKAQDAPKQRRKKRTRNSRVKILFHPRLVLKNPATTIDALMVQLKGLLKN